MPQFLALQCYKCEAFQVTQQKKVNKWCCKICNEKQSVVKVYKRSDQAKEVRSFVMSKNMERSKKPKTVTVYYEPNEDYLQPTEGHRENLPNDQNESRWSQFVEPGSQRQGDAQEDWTSSTSNDCQYVLEVPNQPKQKRRRWNQEEQGSAGRKTKQARKREEEAFEGGDEAGLAQPLQPQNTGSRWSSYL